MEVVLDMKRDWLNSVVGMPTEPARKRRPNDSSVLFGFGVGYNIGSQATTGQGTEAQSCPEQLEGEEGLQEARTAVIYRSLAHVCEQCNYIYHGKMTVAIRTIKQHICHCPDFGGTVPII